MVELQIVILAVAGSSPVDHPISFFIGTLAYLTWWKRTGVEWNHSMRNAFSSIGPDSRSN